MEFDDLYKKSSPIEGKNLNDFLSIVTPKGRKINDDDFQSEQSFVDESGGVDVNAAFGNPEVETRNEFPVKGYQYMLFCFAMAIFLSVLVIIDGSPEVSSSVNLNAIVGDITLPTVPL